MNWFWKRKEASETQKKVEWFGEREAMKKQIAFLAKENGELKLKASTPFIDADMGDPEPVDTEKRRMYVAEVAGLHKEILEPKFKFMISNIHKMMELETNTQKQDDIWRGAVYFAREIMRWGERMVNEQVANQHNQK